MMGITIIVSAITAGMALFVLCLGLSADDAVYLRDRSMNAGASAEFCAEEGLERLREDVYFTGSTTIALATGGSCTIGSIPITATPNTSRVFQATGSFQGTARAVSVSVASIYPKPILSYWLER